MTQATLYKESFAENLWQVFILIAEKSKQLNLNEIVFITKAETISAEMLDSELLYVFINCTKEFVSYDNCLFIQLNNSNHTIDFTTYINDETQLEKESLFTLDTFYFTYNENLLHALKVLEILNYCINHYTKIHKTKHVSELMHVAQHELMLYMQLLVDLKLIFLLDAYHQEKDNDTQIKIYVHPYFFNKQYKMKVFDKSNTKGMLFENFVIYHSFQFLKNKFEMKYYRYFKNFECDLVLCDWNHKILHAIEVKSSQSPSFHKPYVWVIDHFKTTQNFIICNTNYTYNFSDTIKVCNLTYFINQFK